MRAQWQREKEVIDQIRKIAARHRARCATRRSEAQRKGDLGKAAEITLRQASPSSRRRSRSCARRSRRCRRSTSYLREEVTDQDIAGDRLQVDRHPRRQDDAGRDAEAPPHGGGAREARRRAGRGDRGRRQRRPPLPRRASAIRTAPSGASSSSGPRASARPSSRGRSPSSCSTTSAR